jgi:hypothetical protein
MSFQFYFKNNNILLKKSLTFIVDSQQKGIRPKQLCVFPIAWSSKLGLVGQDFFLLFFFFLKPTSMLLPLKSHNLVSFFLTTAY